MGRLSALMSRISVCTQAWESVQSNRCHRVPIGGLFPRLHIVWSNPVFNIFISYRREDSEAHSGRIYDRLVAHYDEKAVFMDVDAIPFGVDFRDHLDKAVAQCDVLLAVIGEQWLDPRLKDGPNQGQRRLDDATDFVRIEIVSALERGIPVIPVLVGKASMPREADLPDCLKKLAFRNAAEVRFGQDFRDHANRLIRGIEHLRKAKEEKEAEKEKRELLLRGRSRPPTARRLERLQSVERKASFDAVGPHESPGPNSGKADSGRHGCRQRDPQTVPN